MAAAMERAFSGLAASTSAGPRLSRVAPRPVHGACRAMNSSCPGLFAAVPAPQQHQPGWSRRRAGDVVCGGLKKETKKLAKTLKAHRKRLESLLTAHAADAATMQLVLAEISQLQSAVNGIREAQEQLKRAAHASSSSSSDSDSDEDDRGSRPLVHGSLVVAAGNLCVQLEPPAVDQEQLQPSIIKQLPPPQQYSSTGRILVCQGKSCMAKGGLSVLRAASHAAAASPGIEVLPCKCLGKCKQGPALRMRAQQPGCTLLTQVDPLEVPDAVDAVFSAAAAAAAATPVEQQSWEQPGINAA